MHETWAIILAAGKSVRMGANKLLMPFSDRTIIETVIGNVMQSDVDNILVVLGAYRDELLPVINRMKVNHCYNENWEQGMLSSVQCGFRNLPDEADAVLLFLGDQPAIPGQVANRLIQEYRRNDKGLVVPVYHDKRGHPMLIDRRYGADIEKLDSSIGLRELLLRYSDDVLEVETEIPGIVKDIDTIQDFMTLTKLN